MPAEETTNAVPNTRIVTIGRQARAELSNLRFPFKRLVSVRGATRLGLAACYACAALTSLVAPRTLTNRLNGRRRLESSARAWRPIVTILVFGTAFVVSAAGIFYLHQCCAAGDGVQMGARFAGCRLSSRLSSSSPSYPATTVQIDYCAAAMMARQSAVAQKKQIQKQRKPVNHPIRHLRTPRSHTGS